MTSVMVIGAIESALIWDRHVLVHAPVPDRPLTKADLLALAKGTN